jgi:sigma-B regulation protein RsbU (phosphoserine phosphatase)
MSAVRSGVRLTADAETSPAELIGRLARLLYESTPSNQFVATVFGMLEIGSGELVVTNGGHVPPLRICAGGGHELLPSDGLVLGAFPDSTYREQRLQLEPGDILVFYTDGLTEMSNPEGEEFGCERLATIVSRCRDQRLADIIAQVRRGAREFRGAAPREDDVTLMLVRWNGPAAG